MKTKFRKRMGVERRNRLSRQTSKRSKRKRSTRFLWRKEPKNELRKRYRQQSQMTPPNRSRLTADMLYLILV